MICPPNIEEIRKFAEENGIDVKYLLGEKYEGDLDLHSVKSLPSYDINTDVRILCPYNAYTNQYRCMQPEYFPSVFRFADEGIYHASPIGSDFFEILDFQKAPDGNMIMVKNKNGQVMSFYFTFDWIVGQNGVGYGSSMVKMRVVH